RTVLVFLSDRALSLEHLDLLHRTLRRSGHRLRRGLRDRSGIARSALILSGQCGDLGLRHEQPGHRIPRRHRAIPASAPLRTALLPPSCHLTLLSPWSHHRRGPRVSPKRTAGSIRATRSDHPPAWISSLESLDASLAASLACSEVSLILSRMSCSDPSVAETPPLTACPASLCYPSKEQP